MNFTDRIHKGPLAFIRVLLLPVKELPVQTRIRMAQNVTKKGCPESKKGGLTPF